MLAGAFRFNWNGFDFAMWHDWGCDMMQAGTLSGNPLAMTAGIKTLEILARPGTYEYLDKVHYCFGTLETMEQVKSIEAPLQVSI